jgi:hypothetical protein
MTEMDALVIASFCIFIAGLVAGRRESLDNVTLFQITSPFYATAFLVMGTSPLANNYGINPNSVIALFTVFLSGSAGETISRNWRGQ